MRMEIKKTILQAYTGNLSFLNISILSIATIHLDNIIINRKKKLTYLINRQLIKFTQNFFNNKIIFDTLKIYKIIDNVFTISVK